MKGPASTRWIWIPLLIGFGCIMFEFGIEHINITYEYQIIIGRVTGLLIALPNFIVSLSFGFFFRRKLVAVAACLIAGVLSLYSFAFGMFDLGLLISR